MRLNAEQDVGEIGDRVDAVRLASRDERVESGQVLAGIIGPDEESTAPAVGSSLFGAPRVEL